MQDVSQDVLKDEIINGVWNGVFTINPEGRISYMNPALENILAMKKADLLGKTIGECFITNGENDEFVDLIFECIYNNGEVKEGIAPYTTGNKVKKLAVRSSSLIKDGENLGLIVIVYDITELLLLQDELKTMEMITKMNHQLKLRNELISNIFGRYLSDTIVKQILDKPDGLSFQGSRRNLTILMSDLRGFTALSEIMLPENLTTMLNHYLMEMTDVIQKYQGTIIEFIGDGIMAIFGAPIFDAQHAEHAVEAALEMQKKMKDINSWNLKRGFRKLEMGIGINTGDVIVGNIGSEKRAKYGVIGKSVNLAGRIESYTLGGQILIPMATREQIDAEVLYDTEEYVEPKGVKQPLKLISVTGIKGARQIFLEKQENLVRTVLKNPVPIEIKAISNKHVSDTAFAGFFKEISLEEALIQTAAPLEIYDNVVLAVGSGLYAKVIEVKDDTYQIHFTSLPDGFEEWMNTVVK